MEKKDITRRKQVEIERKQSEEEIKMRAQQQAAVAELGLRALADTALSVLMDMAVQQVSDILKTEYTKVLELLPDGKTLLLKVGVGWKEGLVGHMAVDAGIDSQAGYTLFSSEPVIVKDLRTEKRFSGPPLLHDHSVVSGMSVIIHGKDRPFGIMGTHTTQSRSFTKDDVHFFQAIANVLAEAIERKMTEEALEKHRDHLEEMVQERTAELANVNKELEAFCFSVSHDLRAPLRGIEGFSLALLEDYTDKLDETGKDYLRRMHAASRRMDGLIIDLLNLSQNTRDEVHRERVDLQAIAEEIIAELKETQSERSVEFVVHHGLATEGDARMLRIVLENLLGNAWKFTGKHDRAKIEFGITHVGGKPAYFVKDNGAGFDMKYSDKLFVAFQRLYSANEFEGSGIGLATVARIIHRHGGRAWAEGEVGKGATFFFTLGI